MNFLNKPARVALLAAPLILTACDDNDSNSSPVITEDNSAINTMSYEVTLTNSTYNQPLSPPALILHNSDYVPWTIGQTATNGLEVLAESGSPDDFLTEASNALDSTSGDDILLPGTSITLTLTADTEDALALTVATMLVNTNDAFTGINSQPLMELTLEESTQFLAPIYDAGTEANNETSSTIPGPAAGGEGFNAEREAHNFVTRHPGVVTQADGYSDSTLDQSHRFDNGGLKITVRRIQ